MELGPLGHVPVNLSPTGPNDLVPRVEREIDAAVVALVPVALRPGHQIGDRIELIWIDAVEPADLEGELTQPLLFD